VIGSAGHDSSTLADMKIKRTLKQTLAAALTLTVAAFVLSATYGMPSFLLRGVRAAFLERGFAFSARRIVWRPGEGIGLESISHCWSRASAMRRNAIWGHRYVSQTGRSRPATSC